MPAVPEVPEIVTRTGRWGRRLGLYLTDPIQEPDMSKRESRLAFRLAE